MQFGKMASVFACVLAAGACGPEDMQSERSAFEVFATQASTSRETVAQNSCDVAAPKLPETGAFEGSDIPVARGDLLKIPQTELSFEARDVVSGLTYLYGIETADYDCDGKWDISFWDSWTSPSASDPGAMGYMLKSNGTLQQITPRDTWPELLQNGMFLYERHKPIDINGDGFLDIVGAGNSNSAYIAYINPAATDPNGLWQRRYLHTLSPGPINLVLHDMDGDGLTDVVINMRVNSLDRGKTTGGLAWLKNPGPRSSERWLKKTVGPSADLDDPRNLQVADFDGNGKPDVYVADSNTGLVSTYFQTSEGAWERQTLKLGAYHGHFGTTVDENGDGVPEILQPVYQGFQMLRFDPAKRGWNAQQLGSFSFDGRVAIISDIVVTDIDADGSADIVFSRSSFTSDKKAEGRGGIYMMRKANDWKPEAIAQVKSSVVELKVIDHDGDGRSDIVANLEYPENRLIVFYQRAVAVAQ